MGSNTYGCFPARGWSGTRTITYPDFSRDLPPFQLLFNSQDSLRHSPHSDRQALAEEIGRQFRRSPAGVPASGLEGELQRTQKGLIWVLQQLETQESSEVRSQVGQLRERFAKDIESLKKRVEELQLEDPES